MERLAYGATDIGSKRDNNEDFFALSPEKDIYIVADGMGGHNAGEVASQNAVRMVDEFFTPETLTGMREEQMKIQEALVNSVVAAHESVMDESRSNEKYSGMGCTIVVAFIHDQILYTCHVGDSRAYIINPSAVTQITNDHSKVGDLVRAGQMTSEEARHSPLKNRITQAIGGSLGIVPELNQRPLSKDDYLLFCTDGLWDMLSDEEIRHLVMKGGTTEEICTRLIEKANEAGGKDNITVVVVKTSGHL
ncbi:MAG: Stp1/IreP family PP2C-type Ser/Thr phosphatase [Thermodesulfobacteriota bacterium]